MTNEKNAVSMENMGQFIEKATAGFHTINACTAVAA